VTFVAPAHVGLGGPRVMSIYGDNGGAAVGFAASIVKSTMLTPRDIYSGIWRNILNLSKNKNITPIQIPKSCWVIHPSLGELLNLSV